MKERGGVSGCGGECKWPEGGFRGVWCMGVGSGRWGGRKEGAPKAAGEGVGGWVEKAGRIKVNLPPGKCG